MDWDPIDFVIMGALLGSVFGGIGLILRFSKNHSYRGAMSLAMLSAFLLIWVNGAVGIIGSENNPVNLAFGGVLSITFVGAMISRLQPKGMARTMYITAAAQVLIAVIVIIAKLGATSPAWPRDILLASGIFTSLWLAAALLFHRSTKR